MKEYYECPWCTEIYTIKGMVSHIWHKHTKEGRAFRPVGNKGSRRHWNFGKTKETDARVAKNAQAISDYYKTNPHPFKGKKHKKETIEQLRVSHRVEQDGDYYRCPRCKQMKHKSEFGKYITRWNGLSFNCKSCKRAKDRDVYQKNKQKERTRSQRYRESHKEECKERSRKHYRSNKEKYLKKNAKRKRNLKWVKLMGNPFPSEIEIVWHHINDIFVVPVPRITHRYYYNSKSKKHRELCNKKLKELNLVIALIWYSSNLQVRVQSPMGVLVKEP